VIVRKKHQLIALGLASILLPFGGDSPHLLPLLGIYLVSFPVLVWEWKAIGRGKIRFSDVGLLHEPSGREYRWDSFQEIQVLEGSWGPHLAFTFRRHLLSASDWRAGLDLGISEQGEPRIQLSSRRWSFDADAVISELGRFEKARTLLRCRVTLTPPSKESPIHFIQRRWESTSKMQRVRYVVILTIAAFFEIALLAHAFG
jgi:hypothetical protein